MGITYRGGAGGTGTVDAVAATEVSVTDAGNHYTSTDVEGVLQEIGDDLYTHTGTLNPTYTSIQFTPGAPPAHNEGELFYDSATNTLAYYTDEPDVTMNIGEELWVTARNNTGATITNGQVVYVSGAIGNKPTIALAKSDARSTSSIIGLATHDIENNTDGRVTLSGLVRGLNTNSFNDGDILWLSNTTAGAYTATKPTVGATGPYAVQVGTVTSKHPTAGIIDVRTTIAIDGTDIVGIGSSIQAQNSNLQVIADASLVYVDKSQWPTIANNSTDSDHDIDFSAGSIPDSTGLKLLTLGSTMVKQIDATWAAGTNAGGRFPGVSLTADTTYHMFLIEKDSDGSIDAGFDTSPVAANIPAGYTAYKRVHSIETDGAANFKGFAQFGDEIVYKSESLDINTGTGSTGGTTLTLSVPSGLTTIKARISAGYGDSVGSQLWIRPTSYTNAAAGSTNFDLLAAAGATENVIHKELAVDSSSQVAWRSTAASFSFLRVMTLGHIDPRVE